jgi:hypothetical protein
VPPVDLPPELPIGTLIGSVQAKHFEIEQVVALAAAMLVEL